MEPLLPNLHPNRLRIVRTTLALFVIAAGISVEIGWATGNIWLKSVLPGIVSMNPHTALCFIIFALCMLVIEYAPQWRTAALAGAAVIFTFGFVRMLGVVGFIDLRLDQVLFHTQLLDSGFNNNRIAPNTSLNLMLMAWALACLALKRWHRMAQTLAFVTLFLALFAILGYFYSVKNLYSFLAYTPMALNTALCFILSAVLVFITTEEYGIMRDIVSDGPGGVLVRRILPAIVTLPAFLGFFILFGVSAGTFGIAYAMAIYVILILMMFTIVVLRSLQTINRIDVVRIEAQNKLSESNRLLDAKLQEEQKQNQQLEQVRLATLNLLEDLNREKETITIEKARDEAMLASIGDGLFATDKEGKIMLVNKVFSESLGWSEAEALGKFLEEIIPMQKENKEKVSLADRLLTQVLKKKVKMTVTGMNNLYFLRRDGTRFPVAITVNPIILHDELIGAVEVFRDVTHEKEVDKAKTEFVSLASHQLRTPLSAIGWYTEMLMAGDAGKITKAQKQYLQEIYAGNQRMVELVNSLLNVSRIDLGTFAIDPQQIQIAEVAKSVVQEQTPMVTAKSLEMKTEIAPDMPQMDADPKLVRIILQNLLSNAIKYTAEKGTVTLRVSAKNKKVFIEVSDTGYGIPKDQQDKIFTKLFRADNVREMDTEGTGLGLYLVKAIVDETGGSIRFESLEDKGTTFFVELPLSMHKKEGAKPLE